MRLTTRFMIGTAALFITGSVLAAAFDLSTLADGETRVFATGGKSATATRTGDAVQVLIQKPGDDDRTLECSVSSDHCTIEVDEAAQKIKLMIMKERHSDDAVQAEVAKVRADELTAGSGGERHIVKIMHGGDGQAVTVSTGAGATFVDAAGKAHAVSAEGLNWVGDDATVIRKEVVCHGEGNAVECDGIDTAGGFDLSGLTDGETRLFGTAERGVTATRNGDVAWLTIHGGEGRQMQCNLTSESCSVLVSDNAGQSRVMVMRRVENAGEVDHEVLMMGDPNVAATTVTIEQSDAAAGEVRVIERVRTADPK